MLPLMPINDQLGFARELSRSRKPDEIATVAFQEIEQREPHPNRVIVTVTRFWARTTGLLTGDSRKPISW